MLMFTLGGPLCNRACILVWALQTAFGPQQLLSTRYEPLCELQKTMIALSHRLGLPRLWAAALLHSCDVARQHTVVETLIVVPLIYRYGIMAILEVESSL